MPALTSLPPELMLFIISHIDLQDVWSLSLSSRRFHAVINEPHAAKLILNTKAKASPEAARASHSGRYSSALRCLFKRREALASARPFLAAVVAVTDSWLYVNGVLIYLCEHRLRILDVHRSGKTELVVDLRRLLAKLPDYQPERKFRFRILHYAYGIASCLYKVGKVGKLIIIQPAQQKVLDVHCLPRTFRLFVCNNDKLLYYGNFTCRAPNDYRTWVLRAFDLTTGKWLADELLLQNMAGYDFGQNIHFDVTDEHLYGVASVTSTEVDETEKISSYGTFQLPTHTQGFDKCQTALIWRRFHNEGIIDDRWNDLRTILDDSSGRRIILETRSEHLHGRRSKQLNYYLTDWDATDPDSTIDLVPTSPDIETNTDAEGQAASIERPEEDMPGARKSTTAKARRVYGCDCKRASPSTRARCFVNSFHPTCKTALYLVDDTKIGSSSRRLRLHAVPQISKAPGPGGERGEQCLHQEVCTWPPDQRQGAFDPALEALQQILSPPTHQGNISSTWDSHSIVYSAEGASGEAKALILLSFDPSIRLQNISAYPEELVSRRQSGADWVAGANGSESCHEAKPDAWCRREAPMHQHIDRGYHFFAKPSSS